METYDTSKIGKCIAWTGDHHVYLYGEDEVIKFSKFDFFMGRKKAEEKSIEEVGLAARFFETYFLSTRVAAAADGSHVALIQPKIIGTYLVPEDLRDNSLKKQFSEIMDAYHRMISEGYEPLDLIGGKGAFSKNMTNIFVTPENKLVLFDATILAAKDFPVLLQPFFYLLFGFASILQSARIKTFETYFK